MLAIAYQAEECIGIGLIPYLLNIKSTLTLHIYTIPRRKSHRVTFKVSIEIIFSFQCWDGTQNKVKRSLDVAVALKLTIILSSSSFQRSMYAIIMIIIIIITNSIFILSWLVADDISASAALLVWALMDTLQYSIPICSTPWTNSDLLYLLIFTFPSLMPLFSYF